MKTKKPYAAKMPNSRWRDIGGERFGMLVAMEPTGNKHHGQHVWHCICDCGKTKDVPVGSLTSKKGGTRSCGCANTNQGNIKHGQTGTPMYERWRSMIRRCNDEKSKSYKYYGAKGVRVCDRWMDFNTFRQDMGNPPGADYELDREDPEGDYDPLNCRWLPKRENVLRALASKKRRKTV